MRLLALSISFLFPTMLNAAQELVVIECAKTDLTVSVQYYDNRNPDFKLSRLAIKQHKTLEHSRVLVTEESTNIERCHESRSGINSNISCNGNIQVELHRSNNESKIIVAGFSSFEQFDEVFAISDCKIQRTMIIEDNGRAWRR